MGLTLRLFVLGLVALVPVICVQILTEIDARRYRQQEVSAQALDSANLASSEIDRILSGVQNLLVAVSKEPSIRELQPSACVPYLAAVQSEVPYLLSLSVIDSKGHLLCTQAQ